MGNKMKINPREVYKKGEEFADIKERFASVLKKLTNECENIRSSWSGDDYDNFKVNYETYLTNLESVSFFLENSSIKMKNNALAHGNIDNTLNESISIEGDDK